MSVFTATTLSAAVVDALERAGYRVVPSDRAGEWPPPGARVFEDPYSIVATVVYETWSDISTRWLEAQAALVDLISTFFHRGDAKAWEGYLVLLTPSIVPDASRLEVEAIRRNTTHARKLVVTGDELASLDDVERALLPLLPLVTEGIETADRTALELLPDVLAFHGVPERATRTVLTAFAEQEPLAERLHAALEETTK